MSVATLYAGLALADSPPMIDVFIDSGEFTFENSSTVLRADPATNAREAYIAIDSGYVDTLWGSGGDFNPTENAISGDTGTVYYKAYWGNQFYDVDSSGDRTALNDLWVGDVPDPWHDLSDMQTIVFGGTFGEPRGRYLYLKLRLDRSGAGNPTLTQNADLVRMEVPVVSLDDIVTVRDGTSAFSQVRVLRGQSRFVEFEFTNRNGVVLSLTDAPVQLFLRDRDGNRVGSVMHANIGDPLAGEADYTFTPTDTDLPPGNYTAEIIAWTTPNFARREFPFIVEESGVPDFHDPAEIVGAFRGYVSTAAAP